MRVFADELRAGIDEAARQLDEPRLAGDDYGTEAYRERLSYLRRLARRHGVEFPLCPGAAARGEAGGCGAGRACA
jgi:hypothetical protein